MSRISLGLHQGGGYRDLAGHDASGFQCGRCGAGLVPGEVVDQLMQQLEVGGGPSERGRPRPPPGRPGCMGNLDRVLLTWGITCVEIEQCPRCRTMLLDAGEFPKVFVIEHGAKR